MAVSRAAVPVAVAMAGAAAPVAVRHSDPANVPGHWRSAGIARSRSLDAGRRGTVRTG